jgi:hypothetical protein
MTNKFQNIRLAPRRIKEILVKFTSFRVVGFEMEQRSVIKISQSFKAVRESLQDDE